jgi:hypothetical protein
LTDKLREIETEIEEVAAEEREAYDNLPEGLQNGERGEAMSAAADALENAHSQVGDALASLEEASA